MNKLGKMLAWTLGPLVVVCLILRLFLFEVWTVPTDKWLVASVAPTLSGGDTVLLLTRGTPGFGDLVRCTDPENNKGFVVGRIVGVPGDTIEVVGGRLTVNNNSYNASDACEDATFPFIHPQTGSTMKLHCGRVQIGSGWYTMGTLHAQTGESLRKATVGPDRVFLLSDNRSVHEDSRDFGTVPLDTCRRRPVLRLWSAKGWTDSKRRFSAVR